MIFKEKVDIDSLTMQLKGNNSQMIYRFIYLLMNHYVFGTTQKLWLIKYCLANSTQIPLTAVPLNFLWHRIVHVLSSPHSCPSPSCIVFVDVIDSAIPNRKLQNYILFKITTITTTLSINIKLMLLFCLLSILYTTFY